MRKLYITAPLWAFATLAMAHGGGVDTNGGHTDKNTGLYHCHRDGCTVPASTSGAGSANPFLPAATPDYRREDWPHWSDFDGDCMNTRHEMLLSAAIGQVKRSPDGCYVSTGQWLDPFSGQTFTRASDLDVDHIVPLKWAHDHGGAHWSRAEKETFANDPDNLLVVDDGLNQAKGAQGPDSWLPPNQAYRCEYLARWSQVLTKYPDLQLSARAQRVFTQQRAACTQR